MPKRLLAPLVLGLLAVLPACKEKTPTSAPMVEVESPDLVELDAAAANRFVTADGDQEVMVRVRITTDDLADQPRRPANVALIIDSSGSMRGEAITEARKAALAMIDGLQPGDQFSVTTFGSYAEVVWRSAVLAPNDPRHAEMVAAIEGIEATGTTAMGEGLALGLDQIASQAHGGVITRAVLLSDGVPNDEARVLQLIPSYASKGIPIMALGLGEEYQEDLLAMMAEQTGGGYELVEDPSAVAKRFREEALHIERTVAANAMLELMPGPGVTLVEVVGRSNVGIQGREFQVALGNLPEGEDKDVIVKLHVDDHADGAVVELLDTVLFYEDAVAHTGRKSENKFLALEATADEAALRSGSNLEVEVAAARALAAVATLEVIELARQGRLDVAETKRASAEEAVRSVGERTDSSRLISIADELANMKGELSSVAPEVPSFAAQEAAAASAGDQAVMVTDSVTNPATMGGVPAVYDEAPSKLPNQGGGEVMMQASPSPGVTGSATPSSLGAGQGSSLRGGGTGSGTSGKKAKSTGSMGLKRAHSRAFNDLH